MRTILTYVVSMVFASFLGALLWLALLPMRKKRRALKKICAGAQREKALLFFFLYLSGLFALTLVPIGFWDSVFNGKIPAFPPAFRGDINLIPLKQSIALFQYYTKHNMWDVILLNFPGNVIIFIPVGFFVGLLSYHPSYRKAVLSAFGISLFIECFQLLVSRGTDIDDLILNTLGGLCGYGIYQAFCRIAPNLVLQCKNKKKGCL